MANLTCPGSSLNLNPGSAGRVIALILSITYPIFLAFSLFYFKINQQSSIYLRKRDFSLILLSGLGSLLYWIIINIFVYTGIELLPCWLFGLFFYLSNPLVAAPLIMRVTRYVSEVSVQTLANESKEGIRGEASLRSFRAHLRVAFLGRKTREDKILNAKFGRTILLPAFWLGINIAPYLITFFARLGTDSSWNSGCTGCTLSVQDFAVLIPLEILNGFMGFYPNTLRISKRDPLRILRECIFGISVPVFLEAIVLVFYATDPGGVFFVLHTFDWKMLAILPAALSIYIQTISQVSVAKRNRKQILASDNFGREDRFTDVMNDKELREELQMYLNSELSGEILHFLMRCEAFKKMYANDTKNDVTSGSGEVSVSEGLRGEAREIYNRFIAHGAVQEINISSGMRKDLHKVFIEDSERDVDLNTFDQAYLEVKKNLLQDGFVRFLNKIKADRGKFLKSNQLVPNPDSPNPKFEHAEITVPATKLDV